MSFLARSFALLVLGGTAASAHTVWFEPLGPTEYRLWFGGHAGKKEPYAAEKLRSAEAFDARGRPLKLERTVDASGVRVRVEGTPALVVAHFDNGFHSRAAQGPSIPKPMNEVPGAVRGSHAVKYHKLIVAWTASVTKPIGQPFEVVPVDAREPIAGKPLRLRVLVDGKPAAGVKLGHTEEGVNDPVTDSNGIGEFVPQPGFNRVWIGRRLPVTGDVRFTEISYENSLAFVAR
jgi:nickel transport protein